QHLEPVGGPVPENEQVAAERVGLQAIADEVKKAVESEPHVDRIGAIPQLDRGGEVQHGSGPRDATSERRKARSQPGGTRRTTPLGKTSSTAVAAAGRRTGSKRGPSCVSR